MSGGGVLKTVLPDITDAPHWLVPVTVMDPTSPVLTGNIKACPDVSFAKFSVVHTHIF